MRLRFGLAVLLPFLALGLQWLLWPWLSPLAWFLFFPAVFFSARLGGLRGGLISTGLSAMIVWYFFIPPLYSWRPNAPSQILSVGMFLLVGALISNIQGRLDAMRMALKIRQIESRYRQIIDNMSSGVAVYEAEDDGRDFIIKDFNPAAQKIENVSRQAVIDKKVTQVFPGVADFGLLDVFRRVWQTGIAENHPISLYKDERIAGWRENHVSKLPSEQIVAIYDDVTVRKQNEEALKNSEAELKRHRHRLEELVKERTAELEAFTYSVSHDLRSPLRGMDGYAKLLLEDHSKKLDEDGRFMLSQICESAHQMGQLIDDLLNFSRLGRQELHLDGFDMNELVQRMFQEIQKNHPERLLRLEVAELPVCHGDFAMIREVIRNLLENAVKFTRIRDETSIEVGGMEVAGYGKQNKDEDLTDCISPQNTMPQSTAEGYETVYYIRDNGAGFNMKYKDKLFQVFQRLHRMEEFEGSGIGLALVKRIVQRHGGRVWAESEPDQGATFYFSLPARNDETRKAPIQMEEGVQ